jgi:hypothetical protein
MTMRVPTTRAQAPRLGANGGRPVYARQLSDAARGLGYVNYRPKAVPVTLAITAGGVAALPTAAAAQVDQVFPPDMNGAFIEMYQLTAQTLLPRLVAGTETKGLEIGLDQVNNETTEFVPGGNNNANPFAYTVGTSPKASFRATLEFEDASGCDQLVIGWRKVQAYQATAAFIAATDPIYTDFAAMGFAGTAANPNPLRIITDLNDSGTPVVTTPGFTIADGLIHTLEVQLHGRKVQYWLNGNKLGNTISRDGVGNLITSQTPATPPAFSFDVGDILVPFIFVRQDADISPIYISPNGILPGIECGPLSEMSADDAGLQQLA